MVFAFFKLIFPGVIMKSSYVKDHDDKWRH